MKYLIPLLILLTPLTTHAQVVINEVAWMGTSTSANAEWIELYNPDQTEVDLTGWQLIAADGAPTLNLSGAIVAGNYYVLERTSDATLPNLPASLIYTGALSNTGENLLLKDAAGKIIDQLDATTGWPGGDNTTKQTLERGGLNTWQTSLQPLGTPGTASSIASATPEESNMPEELDPQIIQDTPSEGIQLAQETDQVKKGDVIITEVFPNPLGPDTDTEFIEIKNVSNSNIDLTGWTIKNSAKQEFTLPSVAINQGVLLTFYRKQTALALNNEKDKIILYASNGKIINQIEYKTSAPENVSYQLSGGKWIWEKPSAEQDLTIESPNNPVVQAQGPTKAEVSQLLTFDASDSFDPLHRDLTFLWDFGDGRTAHELISHQLYTTPGKYQVALKAIASATASSTDILKIEITDPKKSNKAATSTATTTSEVLPFEQIPFIFISEFLPNPKGTDAEGEFIELFNGENKSINLNGWKLSDGTSTFTFKDTLIKPNQYVAVWRTQSKISLNNDEDEIHLLTPYGQKADVVTYQDAKEGNSFVLDEKFIWQQSKTPSPGEINILDEVKDPPEPTSTPKILGAATEEVIPVNQPANKTKYWAAGITSVFALGLGMVLKKKK